jgi:hypothetical protein
MLLRVAEPVCEKPSRELRPPANRYLVLALWGDAEKVNAPMRVELRHKP